MFQNLEVFRSASMVARRSAVRQNVISENVANANTPGYRAQDIIPFQLDTNQDQSPVGQLKTRPGHQVNAHVGGLFAKSADDTATPSPDGNSVTIEHEILKSVEAERSHSRAMTVYQSSLNLLRSSIGRGR